MTSPPETFRYRGIDSRGMHRCGQVTCRASAVATLTATYYGVGWRELAVFRSPGPVPPARDEADPVAGIGRDADGKRRVWWAES